MFTAASAISSIVLAAESPAYTVHQLLNADSPRGKQHCQLGAYRASLGCDATAPCMLLCHGRANSCDPSLPLSFSSPLVHSDHVRVRRVELHRLPLLEGLWLQIRPGVHWTQHPDWLVRHNTRCALFALFLSSSSHALLSTPCPHPPSIPPRRTAGRTVQSAQPTSTTPTGASTTTTAISARATRTTCATASGACVSRIRPPARRSSAPRVRTALTRR
jgi:hypothetical protein